MAWTDKQTAGLVCSLCAGQMPKDSELKNMNISYVYIRMPVRCCMAYIVYTHVCAHIHIVYVYTCADLQTDKIVCL